MTATAPGGYFAVVFDCDGVVHDSNGMKLDALGDLTVGALS